MNDREHLHPPALLAAILRDTAAAGFTLACDPQTGSLLRTLVAAKPGGQVLELGTGTGVGTCWLLDGMDAHSRLISVDHDASVSAVAGRHLGGDPRVRLVIADGATFLQEQREETFDVIFADTFAGKFTHLEVALRCLKGGGLYIVDDLTPQPTWPAGHAASVAALIATLEQRRDLRLTKLAWSSGLLVATKRPDMTGSNRVESGRGDSDGSAPAGPG